LRVSSRVSTLALCIKLIYDVIFEHVGETRRKSKKKKSVSDDTVAESMDVQEQQPTITDARYLLIDLLIELLIILNMFYKSFCSSVHLFFENLQITKLYSQFLFQGTVPTLIWNLCV